MKTRCISVRPLATLACIIVVMNDVPEGIKRKTALVSELENEIGYAESKAVATHRLSLGLMVVALLCSVAAAISGIFFGVSSKIVGGIAILPPLIAYIAVNLKLEAKSAWHYRKSHILRGLLSRLRYQQPEQPTVENVSAIAAERDVVNGKMLEEWNRTLMLNWSGINTHASSQSPESSAAQKP